MNIENILEEIADNKKSELDDKNEQTRQNEYNQKTVKTDEDDQIIENEQVEQKEEQDYGSMNKLDIPFYEKYQGTHNFQKGLYMDAIKNYSKSLLSVQFLVKDGQVTDLQKYTEEIQIPCNLNLALCYMKLNEYSQAQIFCDTVLKNNHDNIKALYRKGVCLTMKNEYKEAKQILKKCLDIDPLNLDVQKALLDLDHKIKMQKKKEILINEKMIQGLDYSEIKTKKENQTQQESKQFQKVSIFQKIMDGIQHFPLINFCKKKLIKQRQ